MKEKTILSTIQKALLALEEVGLTQSSLRMVRSRSFKPILDYFNDKNDVNYNEALILQRHKPRNKNIKKL